MKWFATALVLDLIGAAGALLMSLRTWQTITVPRARPQPDVVAAVSGRDIDGSALALGLVGLAGVVAVLATKGLARRAVGGALVVAGAALVWRAALATSAVDAGRARSLAGSRVRGATLGGRTPLVEVHTVWPVLCVACGVAVVLAGVLVAWRGHSWRAMSSRYEREPDRATDAHRAATTMWSALDRGDDPTTR